MIQAILANPATNYILSFGGLGIVLSLALNRLHKSFVMSERAWGLLTLACGAVGGVLLQDAGLIALPGGSRTAIFALAAFIGAGVAAAAAGFSAVDLRATVLKADKE